MCHAIEKGKNSKSERMQTNRRKAFTQAFPAWMEQVKINNNSNNKMRKRLLQKNFFGEHNSSMINKKKKRIIIKKNVLSKRKKSEGNKWSVKWIWNERGSFIFFNYHWLMRFSIRSARESNLCLKFNFTHRTDMMAKNISFFSLLVVSILQHSFAWVWMEKKYDLWCELLILHNCNGQSHPNDSLAAQVKDEQNWKTQLKKKKKSTTLWSRCSFEWEIKWILKRHEYVADSLRRFQKFWVIFLTAK